MKVILGYLDTSYILTSYILLVRVTMLVSSITVSDLGFTNILSSFKTVNKIRLVRYRDLIFQPKVRTNLLSLVGKLRLYMARKDLRQGALELRNTLNRNVAEALFIKELKPELNEQVKSYKLILFN